MINTLIGAGIAALPLLLLGFLAYGKLLQTVKDLPRLMRMEMKIEIREHFDRHLAQYRHEEKENTSPRIQVATSQEATP
jgi:hypothetical protein